MNFIVGYQPAEGETFLNTILQNRERISEIYFSWGDYSNGRGAGQTLSLSQEELYDKKKKELRIISQNGIDMNLLLNGNCYGRYAQSRSFFEKLGNTLEYLISEFNISSVTTTSLFIARFIKDNFKSLKVRASVNMSIGTIEGMEYVADLFDSFYLQREMNRCFDRIAAVRNWCRSHGKTLLGLANSGCLNYCSAHTFHDNLVSHEHEIAEMDNAYTFESQCRSYLKSDNAKDKWLLRTNFIRPEDVELYEELYDGLKLATRITNTPSMIVSAYVKGSYGGSVHKLLEPNHEQFFYPYIIENKLIPCDFGHKVLHCSNNCNECDYCQTAIKKAAVEPI